MPLCARPLAAPLTLVAVLFAATPTRAESVDVELVLMIDVSSSISEEEYELQKTGHVAAFRDPELHHAIRNGWLGRIAVTYVEWDTGQKQVVPWTQVASAADAMAFADAIEQAPRHTGAPATALASALSMAQRLLGDNGFDGMRRVIDISGDGTDNAGGLPLIQRQRALSAGITINGIVIPNEMGVEAYYEHNVIGGSGAFLIVVEEPASYQDAIRTKLVREIAMHTAAPARLARLGQHPRVD